MIVCVISLLIFPLFIGGTEIVAAGESARYDNYRMYLMVPDSEKQIEILKILETTSDSYTFIVSATKVGEEVSVIVAPHKFAEFSNLLERENIKSEITVKNIQEFIDDESLTMTRSEGKFDWTAYNSLEEIYEWLEQMAKDNPNIVSLITAGTTYEGRKILGAKLSYKSGNPGIFIEAGIHAREWIAPAFATYLLNALVTSNNSSIRSIAENYDWYIVPSVNPDGYVFTHTRDRLWRKTRKPYSKVCYGADPNRNWDFHWSEKGSSTNPCSDIHAGPEAFSEIEVKSYAEYLTSIKSKINTFIGFHAFSQLILFPYGHTSNQAKNAADLLKIGETAARALATRFGTKYKVGNIHDTIYPASGSSMDYAYGVLNIPLCYTYELRPNKYYRFGFELPANQIIPTGLETLDSIVALVNTAKTLGYN